METVGPHLRPPKNPTGAIASLHGPQRTGDQPQHQVSKEDEEEENPYAGAEWTACRGFQKINFN